MPWIVPSHRGGRGAPARVAVWLGFAIPAMLSPAARSAGYDSALAPYPEARGGFAPEVEALLARLEKAALPGGAFSLTADWSVDPGAVLEWGREARGPRSFYSSLDWHPGRAGGYRASRRTRLTALGADVRMETEAAGLSPGDWWEKRGESLFSRRFSAEWPSCWRFHPDALEADFLSYAEGLGLILWRARPLYRPEAYVGPLASGGAGPAARVGYARAPQRRPRPLSASRVDLPAGHNNSADALNACRK